MIKYRGKLKEGTLVRIAWTNDPKCWTRGMVCEAGIEEPKTQEVLINVRPTHLRGEPAVTFERFIRQEDGSWEMFLEKKWIRSILSAPHYNYGKKKK